MSAICKQRFWSNRGDSNNPVPINRAILTRLSVHESQKKTFNNRTWFLPQLSMIDEEGIWYVSQNGGFSWINVWGSEFAHEQAIQWMDIPGFTIKNCEEMAERAK